MEAALHRGIGAGNFNTTHWTIVLACEDESDSARAQEALASLFQTYWYPLYVYVRRRGYSEQDAEDLVQAFCLHLQEKHAVAKVDPQRGKFRTFLLSSLQNFLANENERARAQKRGEAADGFAQLPIAHASPVIGRHDPWLVRRAQRGARDPAVQQI